MNHTSSTIRFRQDINGIRAWAVAAVLLFHFKLFGNSGGFVGVDIFFVISGFLMTSIIVKGHESGSFSLWEFYKARARRIFPALIALVAILLLFGWFWLATADYKVLGHQSSYALIFISNVYFWKHTGYFDTEAHESWLLHTWSLSVEWQFYLLFPIFIILLWKFRPGLKSLTWGLSLIFIASLAISYFSYSPKSFYSLTTRGWELAAGGISYLITRAQCVSTNIKAAIYWLGWVLIIGSIVLISNNGHWPGVMALIPVIGTCLLIIADQPKSIFTSSPVIQWFGDRSYSLYLWHWPFAVALNFGGLEQDLIWVPGAIFLSIILAHLSYQWIELPSRQAMSNTAPARRAIIGIISVSLTLFAAIVVKNIEFERQMPTNVELIANEKYNRDPRLNECVKDANEKGSPGCIYGTDNVAAILVGDSHAASVATAFGFAAKQYQKGIMQLSYSGCQPLKEAKDINPKKGRSNTHCIKLYDSAVTEIEKFHSKIPVIVVSRMNMALWGKNESREPDVPRVFFSKVFNDSNNPIFQQEFKHALKSWACNIAKNRPVYLTRPIPEMGLNVPNTLSRNILFNRTGDDVKISLKAYHQRNKFVWEAQNEAASECGIKILNPLPHLCDKQYCYGSKNDWPLYFDDNHLSEHGNKLLRPMFKEVFQ